jgi:hypothetical protein
VDSNQPLPRSHCVATCFCFPVCVISVHHGDPKGAFLHSHSQRGLELTAACCVTLRKSIKVSGLANLLSRQPCTRSQSPFLICTQCPSLDIFQLHFHASQVPRRPRTPPRLQPVHQSKRLLNSRSLEFRAPGPSPALCAPRGKGGCILRTVQSFRPQIQAPETGTRGLSCQDPAQRWEYVKVRCFVSI